MKSKVTILAALVLTIVTASCNDGHKTKIKKYDIMQSTEKQKAGILQAIDQYVESGRSGDSKSAKEAFAQTATMSWTENGELKSVPIQTLYDFFDTSGPADASYELTNLDVEEDAAIVRIESQFGATKYADMFTLVKEGEKWKIISKIYHIKK